MKMDLGCAKTIGNYGVLQLMWLQWIDPTKANNARRLVFVFLPNQKCWNWDEEDLRLVAGEAKPAFEAVEMVQFFLPDGSKIQGLHLTKYLCHRHESNFTDLIPQDELDLAVAWLHDCLRRVCR